MSEDDGSLTSDSPADQRFSMSVKERDRGAARAWVEVRRTMMAVRKCIVGLCWRRTFRCRWGLVEVWLFDSRRCVSSGRGRAKRAMSWMDE